MDFLDQINSKRAELAKTQVKIADTKLKLEKQQWNLNVEF